MWDRLRWARTHSQSQMTPAAAAAAIDVAVPTYRAYERAPGTSRSTPIDLQSAITLGRRWKISWQWIVSGEGTPFDKPLTPLQVRVVAALDKASPEIQAAVERMLTGTNG